MGVTIELSLLHVMIVTILAKLLVRNNVLACSNAVLKL